MQEFARGKSSPAHPNWIRRLLVVVGVLLLVTAAFALRGWLLRGNAANRDFISYWASAKLLVAHHNPYDRAAVLNLETGAGGAFRQAFLMRNPPWALFLVLPLGWMTAPTAALVWMIAIIAAALISVRLLRPPGMNQVPLSLLLFAPVVMCAGAEQTGAFLLLAIALFIRYQGERPWLAGMALALACAKPHLLLLFWFVLALDAWRRRDFRIPAGMALGIAAALAPAMAADPLVWSHYLTSMRAEQVQADFYPNLANLLRAVISPRSVWLAALPTLAGAAFSAWYWRRHREHWSWEWHGSLIVAVSVLTAPYSWPSDEVLFLPALLAAARWAPRMAMGGLALLNVCALLVFAKNPLLGKPVYSWMGAAWMLWCAWVWRLRAKGREDRSAENGGLAAEASLR